MVHLVFMRGPVSVVVAIICMTTGMPGCAPKSEPSHADIQQRVKVTVKTATVVRTDLRQVRAFTGVLEPLRKVDLAPSMPGKVSRLPVEIGDRVAKDQVLAQMDDALLATTSAQFQPLKAQYERMLRLYANKTVSRVQFEQVEAQYVAMKRQLDQVQENTTIKAPFSGVVTDRTAEEGEIYSPKPLPGRSSGLVQITQLDPLKIDIDVDEITVARLKKGMSVSITCDALADSAGFAGTVLWINPAANPLSRTFMVRVIIPNRDLVLKPGYFVRLAVLIASKPGVLVVPADALVDKRVYVVNSGVAIARPVKTGLHSDGLVEVLEGVTEGEMVAISGNKALPDTAQVEQEK